MKLKKNELEALKIVLMGFVANGILSNFEYFARKHERVNSKESFYDVCLRISNSIVDKLQNSNQELGKTEKS